MQTIKNMFRFLLNLKPWIKIIIAMVLGSITGLFLKEQALLLKPIGTVFINSIMMMIGPVIFVSIVCGVISMKDPLKMGRIASKTFFVYFFTMAIGTCIGLLLSSIFEPGLNVSFSSLTESGHPLQAGTLKQGPNIIDTLVGFVPTNILVSFTEGNVLQIITFSVLLGFAINFCGPKAKPVEDFFNGLLEVIFQLIHIVMKLAPMGVFALMAIVSGTQGSEVLLSLLNMLGIIYLSMITLMVCVYVPMLKASGLSPLIFFKKMLESQAVAFSTASSAAALPVNLEATQDKLGVSKSITNFVLPLGATVNMNGLSTYLGVIAIFAANLYGIELSFADKATIVFTSTIAAIGCAGVPAAGLVILPMVLSAVGIPLEIIGVIAAVNRIIDMASTTTNITGDTLAAVIVAKSEGELDLDVYYDRKPSWTQSEAENPVVVPLQDKLNFPNRLQNH